ncbi:conserved hypothetical protein [Ricinus communis]|uniref:Uncharacterized protein n=1 Tax=Ricinus communis TaxID=3988 RepID=B9THP1_RICCO|nr:conserved hypothetical protein [Ricinus communis]
MDAHGVSREVYILGGTGFEDREGFGAVFLDPVESRGQFDPTAYSCARYRWCVQTLRCRTRGPCASESVRRPATIECMTSVFRFRVIGVAPRDIAPPCPGSGAATRRVTAVTPRPAKSSCEESTETAPECQYGTPYVSLCVLSMSGSIWTTLHVFQPNDLIIEMARLYKKPDQGTTMITMPGVFRFRLRLLRRNAIRPGGHVIRRTALNATDSG